MPVTSCRTNLLQDRKELYQLLFRGKQQAVERRHPQIVSISQEIDPIDPLAVLQAIAKPNYLQFYLENRERRQVTAAIDATLYCEIGGSDRFDKARDFILSCLENTIHDGCQDLPFSGMHFFCSFTFFDKPVTHYAPFASATIFLPRWQISRSQDSYILVTNVRTNSQTNVRDLVERLCSQFKMIGELGRRTVRGLSNRYDKFIDKNSINKTKFKGSVASALKSIQAHQFNKIVLANAIDVISPSPFNLIDSLQKLRQRHPACYVFSTSNGKGQHFIGASPERLLSIRDRKLITDALAGSAPRGKTTTDDARLANRLLSSDKERREHRFVLDFITDRLAQFGLVPQSLPIPQLLQLSNIQHLWTPIHAQLSPHIHPLEIVAALHPTPAVAGVPTEIAQAQILTLETFDRSLYAAPLGWVDYQGNCEFVVGIRSALIESEKPSSKPAEPYKARLYAGAGIVAGSDPEREFAEIQLKLQALLKALL
jgi:menaquinone-specific isochorismate synthase